VREAERRLCARVGRVSSAAGEGGDPGADWTQSVVMQRPLAAVAAAALASTIACSGSTPPPASPATPSTALTPDTSTTLTGAWAGTGSDPQGPEKMTWSLTQTANAITGTADLSAVNAADGSCASCHKAKTGTIAGTVAGSTIAMRLVFPAGGDGVPTPECTITFDATASMASHDRIEATYTGADTCEGPITGGTFTMTR
jgi:hypothetical protein